MSDPAGIGTATPLEAWLHAEHLTAFCRLLWRRLAILATIWLLLGWLKIVPAVGVIVGMALFVVLAVGAAVLASRARKTLLVTSRLAGFRGNATGTGTG